MRPKFITAVYFEGRILLIGEHGAIYEFQPRMGNWQILSEGPPFAITSGAAAEP